MADRAEFIRESMRQSWGQRTATYTRYAAPRNAAYTAVLLTKVALQPGERVLDVATGPGVVAVAAARAVGPRGEVVATDLAPQWAEAVAEGAAQAGVANVRFQAMGAEALDLPDGAFDVALCQFGLMFVPHPVQALREMRRVLREGGRLGVVVWSTAEKVACFGVSNRLLAPFMPAPPADQQLPGPLELAEPGLLERLIREAGFRETAVERHTLDYVLDDPEELWGHHVEQGPPAVRAAVGALSAAERERLHAGMIAAAEGYRQGDKIRLPSEAIFATARR